MLLEYLRITGGQNLLALGANNSGRGVGGAPVYWAAFGLLGELPSWADNRVELAAETDRFGLLGAKVTFNLHDNDKRLIAFGQRKVEEIMRAAGAQEVAQEARFAHLIGGARMGLDPRDSVVDGFGRAHDIPHLFICDGSILPTQGSANPGLTIQALAARVADYLIAEQERVLDGGPRRGTPPPGTSGRGVPRLR